MTPQELHEARLTLGLSVSQMSAALETDPQTWRRMTSDESASTHRKPAVRMVRLIRAYLDGWRPDDWPRQADAGGE